METEREKAEQRIRDGTVELQRMRELQESMASRGYWNASTIMLNSIARLERSPALCRDALEPQHDAAPPVYGDEGDI